MISTEVASNKVTKKLSMLLARCIGQATLLLNRIAEKYFLNIPKHNGVAMEKTSPDDSQNLSDQKKIENFIIADWKDDTIAVMLCLKCEEPFDLDPCKEEHVIWCSHKKVFVPQCPHCGVNDIG